MDLDTEKFNSVKELAEVQLEISAGRAALSKLMDDTKAYLELREVAAHERVDKVLKESVEALESTKENHAALAQYASGLRALAIELSGFSKEITTLFSDFRTIVTDSDAKLDIRLSEVRAREKEVMIGRGNLEADQEALNRDMAILRDEIRLLADRQVVVQKAADSIRKITGKNL